jgi:hypothetical protein
MGLEQGRLTTMQETFPLSQEARAAIDATRQWLETEYLPSLRKKDSTGDLIERYVLTSKHYGDLDNFDLKLRVHEAVVAIKRALDIPKGTRLTPADLARYREQGVYRQGAS